MLTKLGEILLHRRKVAGDFATGLPDRRRFGDISQIPKGQLLKFVIQKHLARRSGPHFDIRLHGAPRDQSYSWATKKELPGPGEKRMLYQQPLHSGEYSDFQGELPTGYGAGTVKTHDKGSVIVTKADHDKISFIVAHKKYPEYFTMLRSSGPPTKPRSDRQRRSQGGSWLLINTTPLQATKLLGGKASEVGLNKLRYATVPSERVESVFGGNHAVQEKIDGASLLYHLLGDRVEAVSYRAGQGGRPIIHTHRIFGAGGQQVRIPKELIGTILRGEAHGVRGGKTIPPQELGGILNASVANSLEKQKAQNVRMKNLLFDVVRLGSQPLEPGAMSSTERSETLRKIIPLLPKDRFSLPETASTPDAARALWEKIISGKHPRTSEGIVAWPNEAGKRPIKVKATPEADVWVKNIFPGEGKYKGVGAGGFEYSNSPEGDTVGRVGTGFSDQVRQEMLGDPEAWKGRLARIRSQGKFPDSGAHRAPVFHALHEDYTAQDV